MYFLCIQLVLGHFIVIEKYLTPLNDLMVLETYFITKSIEF